VPAPNKQKGSPHRWAFFVLANYHQAQASEVAALDKCMACLSQRPGRIIGSGRPTAKKRNGGAISDARQK